MEEIRSKFILRGSICLSYRLTIKKTSQLWELNNAERNNKYSIDSISGKDKLKEIKELYVENSVHPTLILLKKNISENTYSLISYLKRVRGWYLTLKTRTIRPCPKPGFESETTAWGKSVKFTTPSPAIWTYFRNHS